MAKNPLLKAAGAEVSSTPIVIVIQAANVNVRPFDADKKGKNAYAINNTSLSITPPSAEIQSVVSTQRDTLGQSLAAYAGETTPPEVSLAFNQAPAVVFALAMGGTAEQVAGGSGDVTDAAFETSNINSIVYLPQINITDFVAKDAQDAALVEGTDYQLDGKYGEVLVLSEKMAAEGVKVTYKFDMPEHTRMKLGKTSSFRMNVKFSGINAATGRQVRGEMFDITVTPTDPIDIHSGEPVTATLTGKMSTPFGEEEPYYIDFF